VRASQKALRKRCGDIRELLDRGYGRARQSWEVSLPEPDIVRIMLDEIDARNKESDRLNALKWKQSGSEAAP